MTSSEFKTIRQSLGLSQQALADIMGCSQQAINRIETTRTPTKKDAAFISYIARNFNSMTFSVKEITESGLGPELINSEPSGQW